MAASGCRLPNEAHEVVRPPPARRDSGGSSSSPPQSPGAALALQRGSASVVAFSPCGTLLAVAVEEPPRQWLIRVRRLPRSARVCLPLRTSGGDHGGLGHAPALPLGTTQAGSPAAGVRCAHLRAHPAG